MLRESKGYLRARTIIFPATLTQIFPSHTQFLLAFAAVQGKNFSSDARVEDGDNEGLLNLSDKLAWSYRESY